MKKNLIILLLIPFLIALLGVVTLNTTFSFIDNDIIGIQWDYDEVEAFKLSTGLIPLKAKGVNEKNYPAGAGNALTWSITNEDPSDETVYAEIVKQGSNFYLKTINCGRIYITCSNEKGNVFKTMNVIIYENGAIIVKPKISSSGNNIDSTIYYGEYNLKNGLKEKANIEFSISAVPESMNTALRLEDVSDNIEVDIKNGLVKVLYPGDASFTIGCGDETIAKNANYKFNIVEEGVNVYTYNDLLYCTNKSTNGEIVVLRKSFESVDNAYVFNANGNIELGDNNKPILKSNNVECFGNYDAKTDSFNFANEIYSFKTTYNNEYIRQWNEYIKSMGGKNTISDQVLAALRVQKDFYGNGYTINLHNLTFPSSVIETTDSLGNIIKVPTLANSDLFRGPLPFYALGDPSNMPLVEAFGQDNIGMYVNGSNITVNDVNIKNCDFGNMLSNLNTVGTVMEIAGDNVTLKNSRLSNGKNVLRCFSSNNILIDNSLLSNSRNFLITTGSNEYITIDDLEKHNFLNLDGSITESSINDYFKFEGQADFILNYFLEGSFSSKLSMKNSLISMQNAFNNEDKIKNIYKGSLTIKDSYFYQSGIASIALETMFNGPFLYNGVPSSISGIISTLHTSDGTSLSDFIAKNIGGVSYPVEVTITGNTKFYDYKNVNSVDINGLIKENISAFAQSIKPDFDGSINIDKIFPIKTYLIDEAKKNNFVYQKDGASYINIPIAYYGGGINLSKVIIDEGVMGNNIGSKLTINFLDSYLELTQGTDLVSIMKNMMMKAVTVVTGYEPFYFECVNGNGYLFGESPKVSDLIQNTKGGKSDEKN